MDRDKAFAWADRLDSGEEIQGFAALEYTESNEEDVTKRCCLGVAARMCYIPEDQIRLRKSIDRTETFFYSNSGTLPAEIQEELGMCTDDGCIPSLEDREGNHHYSLATLNDHGFTFPQIADLIRHFYEEL